MSITIIMGPMFSGKTTELRRRVNRFRIAGRRCVIIKHTIDTRYASDLCCTHDGVTTAAVLSSTLCGAAIPTDCEVIGIDEGQFFDDLISFCDAMANRGVIVIVAALDSTYQRRPFGHVLELVPLAEFVIKLLAVCVVCHGDAAFTGLVPGHHEPRGIQIGGAEMYRALCRRCYA
jgi:thymidine kinase